MTIKVKFKNIDELDKTWNQIFKQQEKIADDYAIQFAEWIKNDWACNERWSKITDSKELLEIFKKEKGL